MARIIPNIRSGEFLGILPDREAVMRLYRESLESAVKHITHKEMDFFAAFICGDDMGEHIFAGLSQLLLANAFGALYGADAKKSREYRKIRNHINRNYREEYSPLEKTLSAFREAIEERVDCGRELLELWEKY